MEERGELKGVYFLNKQMLMLHSQQQEYEEALLCLIWTQEPGAKKKRSRHSHRSLTFRWGKQEKGCCPSVGVSGAALSSRNATSISDGI